MNLLPRSAALLLLCIGLTYIFMRGFLGVLYEIADWTLRKLDGPGQ